MPTKIDHDESELLDAFEQGQQKPVATKSELAKFKAAARATALKNRPPDGAPCSKSASDEAPDVQKR
ncbi:MAG TPA: hypothetical protein VFW84_04565 [Aquabacterium sp.]|uniref:hypothetical protein n=1 Tax=Aquabacterium sp. TaxID=1872578 RepID=UPI002E3125DF|nr:hypothetical protein [Aquabacterium sp.]HEX5371985.1 hypothetical protein [Aquabacterium sp.]